MSLTAPEGPIEGSGGSGVITVTTQPECAWTAAAEASWISNLVPAQGQGNGEVRFQVSQNPSGSSARESAVVVNNQRAIIRQNASACRFGVGSSNNQFGAAGGTGTITLTGPGGCDWTASSDVSWIAVSPLSGAGGGSVTFTVAVNTGAARTGTITAGGVSIAIVQSGSAGGPPSCMVALQPTSTSVAAAGGPGTVAITTNAGCTWTASSAVPWITLTTAASGSGNGNVGFNVAANTSSAARLGSLTIGTATFTVSQTGAPCTVSINPTSQSVTGAGGNVDVAVSTATGCPWGVASHAFFVTIAAGASGSGNGTVTLSVAPNTGSARTGTATIGGQTFTVNQACQSSIGATSRQVGAGAATEQTVVVTTLSGCTWTATSNASWLTITAGAIGTGTGNVEFSVAANTGAARTGTLTIAGETLTVTQAASVFGLQ